MSTSCVQCEKPGYPAADGHLCITHGGVPSVEELQALVALRRPAPLWYTFTWGFIAVTAVHAALIGCVALLGIEGPVASGLQVSIWVNLAVFFVWFAAVGRLAEWIGHDPRVVLRHWTLLVSRVLLVPLVVYTVLTARAPLTPGDQEAALVAAGAGRMLMLGLLVVYVVIVWRRLRGGALR